MTERRVLVVGASSGIGASVAKLLESGGWQVAGAARRYELVPASVQLACDVRDPAACAAVVEEAARALGGLDGLVYATGSSPLRPLAETTAAEWEDVLRTNLVGAALVTAAALPHLAAVRGGAVYLSSHSVPEPWPGLGAYAASKAALETTVKAWAAEQPAVGFASYVVGPTLTNFAAGWDLGLATAYGPRWQRDGRLDVAAVRQPDEVAAEVIALLESLLVSA